MGAVSDQASFHNAFFFAMSSSMALCHGDETLHFPSLSTTKMHHSTLYSFTQPPMQLWTTSSSITPYIAASREAMEERYSKNEKRKRRLAF